MRPEWQICKEHAMQNCQTGDQRSALRGGYEGVLLLGGFSQFADGEAEGTFKVTAPADDSNPKTGDSFALHSWTALLFISLTSSIGAAFAFRKNIWK